MTDKRDYYEVLGVSRTATAEEIKLAYRNLARKHHPDVNREPHAETVFKEINEAYEVLSQEEKRRVYDTYGHQGMNGAGFSPSGAGFSDIFDMFFGMRGGPGAGSAASMAEHGDDLRHDIEISLEEAARGVEKTVRF